MMTKCIFRNLEWFLIRTKKVGNCLIWTKCIEKDGYAKSGFRGKSNGKVHRIVYQLSHPEENIDGKVIRHSCDNPSCINPDHLLSGTCLDNIHDRDNKERNGWAKITKNQVVEIRTLYKNGGILQKELAERFGINGRTISSLINRTHWKSVA